MKKYDQNFKTESLKLSDDIGVKKVCELRNIDRTETTAGKEKQAGRTLPNSKSHFPLGE